METLDWKQFLGNRSVDAAYRRLRDLAPNKALLLHSRSLVPKKKAAFWCAARDTIHIFVDASSSLVFHAIVHELMHGILMGEGYHRLTGDLLRCDTYVRNVLSNEFQHPEVYRRMEEYALEMTPYWNRCWSDLHAGLRAMKADLDQAAGYRDFPQVFSWFFFPHVSAEFLSDYSLFNPVVYRAALRAHDDVQAIGFSTADKHRQSLGIFKQHWLQYCEDCLPSNAPEIQAVKHCRTKSVAEIVDARSENEVIAELMRDGLRQA